MADNKDENNFASRLSGLLLENEMTQRGLAEAAGMNETTISRYTGGARIPKAGVVAKLAAALHTTSDYLLGMEAEKSFDMEYEEIRRLLKKNAKHWTVNQKKEIIDAILGV